jgi:hypothetical protein
LIVGRGERGLAGRVSTNGCRGTVGKEANRGGSTGAYAGFRYMLQELASRISECFLVHGMIIDDLVIKLTLRGIVSITLPGTGEAFIIGTANDTGS